MVIVTILETSYDVKIYGVIAFHERTIILQIFRRSASGTANAITP